MGANSPFLFGQRLWAETRTELFLQATDTRSVELQATRACGRGCSSASGGSPRSSTCSRRTCGTSRRCCRMSTTRTRSPVLDAGGAPRLQELRLHNGTIYRWNRPVYDVVGGRPHLRVENRVLPAGPTVVDVLANAAFYYGAIGCSPPRTGRCGRKMLFATAEQNFDRAPRHGHVGAVLLAGLRRDPGDELVLRHLLPLAHEGWTAWGVAQRPRPVPRHHRGPLQDRAQRRGLAGRDGDRRSRSAAWTGRPRCARCCGSTPTDAQQRAGAHLGGARLRAWLSPSISRRATSP